MTIANMRAAAILAASLLWSCNAVALSFDERWRSLFMDGEVTGDPVAAKAEMARQVDPKIERKVERPARAQRSRAYRHRGYRHRASSDRGERRREWYKGGKKWHYVYTRKRG